MRRHTALFFFIVLLSGSAFLLLQASHGQTASSDPPKPTPGQAAQVQVTAQDFQSAQDRISNLEKDNDALKKDIEDLKKTIRENYPSELEQNLSDLSLIGTYIAIALTLAALVVALVSFNKFQDAVRKDSREEAIKVVNSLRDYLQGRFYLIIGYVLGQVAWDKRKAYEPTSLGYLSDEAQKYLATAYDFLGRSTEPEFKKQMDQQRWFALNNLIFYITLSPDGDGQSKVATYALELKKAPNFRSNGIWINTYCRAALHFAQAFAKETKTSVKDVLDEVESLCKAQENNSLKASSLDELARIKEHLQQMQKSQL